MRNIYIFSLDFEVSPLEEHRKVYRQIQDRTFLHHIRAIGHPGKDADVVEIQFQEILG